MGDREFVPPVEATEFGWRLNLEAEERDLLIRLLGELKGLLKYAYRGILPDSVLDRRKKGFSTPRYYFGAAGPAELQKSIFEGYRS